MKNKIKGLINGIIRFFSYLIPKSKRIWVFGAWSGKLYADNAKCMFDYLHKIDSGRKLIWITSDKKIVNQVRAENRKAYYRNSLPGIWYAIRAKVAFYTESPQDVSQFINKKTEIIQLWHGMGIKAVGLESGWTSSMSEEDRIKQEGVFKKHHVKWHWMAASDEAKQKYMRSFGVPAENFTITGQPKDDILAVEKENAYITEIRRAHPGAKVALYLPTHRNFGKKGNINDVMSVESLEKVNAKLAEKNIVMIFKPHFHEFAKYAGYEGTMGNIVFATDKEKFGDVYEFLPACDIMVTDYSGIMFGYLASGKPIIYFTYDYDEYVNGDAGFCYDFSDITYGPDCKTWDEVVETMATIRSEDYAEIREKQRARFCPYADGKNSERVYNAVIEILEGKKK